MSKFNLQTSSLCHATENRPKEINYCAQGTLINIEAIDCCQQSCGRIVTRSRLVCAFDWLQLNSEGSFGFTNHCQYITKAKRSCLRNTKLTVSVASNNMVQLSQLKKCLHPQLKEVSEENEASCGYVAWLRFTVRLHFGQKLVFTAVSWK
jgi:hypothetical protein